jgi:hypothetical protein
MTLTLPTPTQPTLTAWLDHGEAHVMLDGCARVLSAAELEAVAVWFGNAAEAIGDAR